MSEHPALPRQTTEASNQKRSDYLPEYRSKGKNFHPHRPTPDHYPSVSPVYSIGANKAVAFVHDVARRVDQTRHGRARGSRVESLMKLENGMHDTRQLGIVELSV